MKRTKLLLALAIICICSFFVGCKIGFETYEQLQKTYNITSIVTYYANGGYFGTASTISCEIDFTSGSKFYNVGESTSIRITRSNYTFNCWYEVEKVEIDGELYFVLDLDSESVKEYSVDGGYGYYYHTTYTDSDDITSDIDYEGEIIEYNNNYIMSQEDYDLYVRLKKNYSNDGTINVPLLKSSDSLYDESCDLVDGEHIYVVADWMKANSVNYHVMLIDIDGSEDLTATVDGEIVTSGDVIYNEYFGSQLSLSGLVLSNVVTVEGYTLIGSYMDEDCTIAKDAISNTGDDVDVYSLYIKNIESVAGSVISWTIVSNATTAKQIFTSGTKNIYLTCDVDLSSVSLSTQYTFNQKIEGNGYTLSNLSITKSSIGADEEIAIFGEMAEGAYIHNLTLDGVSIKYTTTSRAQFVNLSLVCSGVKGAVDVTGLTINNAELIVTLATYSGNDSGYTEMLNVTETSDGYDLSKVLYNMDTSEFENAYGGITITNSTITIVKGSTSTTLDI